MLWLILHLILLGYSLLVHHLLAFCGGAPFLFTPNFSIFAAEQISSVHYCQNTADHQEPSAFSDTADWVFHWRSLIHHSLPADPGGSSGVKFLSSTLDNARWQAVPVPSPGVTSCFPRDLISP